MSPPIPTYNSVPAAQALSYPMTTRTLAAPTRWVARPPLGHRVWHRPAGGAAGARAVRPRAGAFTGALAPTLGCCELAHQGTPVLDETEVVTNYGLPFASSAAHASR